MFKVRSFGKVLLFLLLLSCVSSAPQPQVLSVSFSEGKWKFQKGKSPTAIAWAEYNRTYNQTGWATLRIHTNDKYVDHMQAYAAGLLEGRMTQTDMWYLYSNFFSTIPSHINGLIDRVLAWYVDNYQWSQHMAATNKTTFWQHTALTVKQQEGLIAGYNMTAPKAQQIPLGRLLAMAGAADLQDIGLAVVLKDLNHHDSGDNEKMLKQLQQWGLGPLVAGNFGSHCTSLTRVTPDHKELFFGHTTWSDYVTMLRIYKYYELNYKIANAKAISFPSYPGIIWSMDDFYMTSSNLCVIETTNEVFNLERYKYVHPHSLITWQRIMTANRAATGGKDWVDIFSQYLSGTYNNQWIIIDLNKFEPGKKLKPDTLWIHEAYPVGYQAGDVTSVLESQGYWPSYNVPYFKHVFDTLGYPLGIALEGPGMLSYKDCKRAQLLRQYYKNVNNMEEYKAVQRSNEYETSKIGDKNPYWAISSRGDLSPFTDPLSQYARKAFGGTDSKVCSYSTWKTNKTVIAQSGPTLGRKGTIPPFSWKTTKAQVPQHIGMPELFNFDWQAMKL